MGDWGGGGLLEGAADQGVRGGGEGSVNGGGVVEDQSKPGGESERGWVGLGLSLVAGCCCVGQPDYAVFCRSTRTAEE